MNKDESLFNVGEGAQFLNVSVKTIRRWAQQTKLEGIKVGPRGDWRFTKDQLLQMVSNKSIHKSGIKTGGEEV